jgi:glycosyltransferase involved in cell wall biosynthesis
LIPENVQTNYPDISVTDETPQRQLTALVWCSVADPAGGMERIALNLANGLARNGWRTLLAGPFGGVDFLSRSISPKVELIHHRADKSVAGLVRTSRFLQRVVKERGVDVVSAHGSVFPLLPITVPVVWTEHALRYGGREMLRGSRGLAWRRIRDRLARRQWQLVTVSHYVRNETCSRLKLPNFTGTVVHNGVPNVAALEELPPPELTPPYQIGFLGRLVDAKHPLDVFELSRLLNRMGTPHVWRVFGDGVLLPAMREAMAKPGHSVELCGLVEKPEEAFAQIDLLSFQSHGEEEGLPTVLIEALLANRLVVAWDAPSIREVLDRQGTLVPTPHSLERFAEAIAATLQRGRQHPERDGRWREDRMIDAHDSILTSAVRSRAQAGAAGGAN